MRQRGFTLTELLVATIVFLVGFVSVFGLFLGGMRMRKLAEDTTRASLTASCIIEEIRIDAGGGGGSPRLPSEYVGDGFAPFNEGTNPEKGHEGIKNETDSKDNPLFRYKPIPGTWYRVIGSTDLYNGDNANTTVLKIELIVVPFGSADRTLSFADIERRLSLFTASERKRLTQGQIADRLVERGIGFRYTAVVSRRPSWLP
jgi:prepilin-type N-terminal cleavage/methylation domain-containing protein